MTKSTSPRFDWSAPRFLPLTIEVKDDCVILSAAGQTARLDGKLFQFDCDNDLKESWQMETNQAATGDFHTFSLEIEATRETLLKDVAWFAGEWDENCERFVSSTDLSDNVLFLRVGDVSFFLSLDFPYSKITASGITYPPHQVLQAGEKQQCHTLSVGACKLSGISVGEVDRAEIEAVSDYIERRYPQRFERPMFVSACITNRLNEVEGGRIFYSMHNNPTLYLNPDLMEEDIRLMSEIGVEYFQVFEGLFDWPDQEKTGAALRRMVELGKNLGVRIGDYVVPQIPYCPHYNYSHREIERDEWKIRTDNGTPGLHCFGCNEYFDWFRKKTVEHNREFKEEMICLDFLAIQPCYAENHDHPVGDTYQQVRALVQLCQELADLSPNFLIFPNAGNCIEFMPKLTWFTPNVYLTDPHTREYSPTLSLHKLMGDTRREQMVSVHDLYFVPWRNYTNCEYYAFPASRVHDHRVFEYSFLQGLAVTPNICPA